MKKVVLTLSLLAQLSCRSITLDQKLVTTLHEKCSQFPCQINMKEVATFDWDKMFVFGYEVSVDEIERVAGVKITENQQFKRKIIFTKDQKLVYYEELPTDIEQAIPNEVFFGDAVGGPQVYAVDGAIFDANEIAVGNTVCYRLKVAGNNE